MLTEYSVQYVDMFERRGARKKDVGFLCFHVSLLRTSSSKLVLSQMWYAVRVRRLIGQAL